MLDLEVVAVGMLALAAATVFLTMAFPTRSRFRQSVYLGSYATIALLGLFYLCELHGVSSVVPVDGRGYIVVTGLALCVIGVIIINVDLYLNFDQLRNDPAYAMMGQNGLAFTIMILAVYALALLTLAWYAIDPDILIRRASLVALTTAGDRLTYNDFLLFGFDQAQKAMLFDISEVYSFGLTDLGNNPAKLAFSTACLVYRTYLSGFVAVMAYRLIRREG